MLFVFCSRDVSDADQNLVEEEIWYSFFFTLSENATKKHQASRET